jgi:predicted DNA-binding transcriptional regulator YafY
VELSPLRAAIRTQRIVTFSYETETGARSTRRVRPLSLVFFAPVWLVLGWCEMRGDFRNFRIDRMSGLVVTDARFRDERGKRLKDYFATHPEEKAPNWG